MAKQNYQNTSSIESNSFNKGMNKDLNPSLNPPEVWTHARNAANNSADGDVGLIGNEPANLKCGVIPYPVIGAIHKQGDEWFIFSTDDNTSEIGLFDDSKCEYTTIVNSTCLNFNRKHLIVGASKENYDCTWQVYWDDSNNPSRTLNVDDIPWIQNDISTPGSDCTIYEDTIRLDCEKLRLAPLLDTPCVELKKSESGGQLRNGSYQAFIAYVVNEQKVTDYIGISNVQSLFDHSGTAGSLNIKVTNLDKEFEYYELVILSNNQQSIVAKKIGLYSTEQSDIEINYIDQSLPSIPLNTLFLRSPAYEKSDTMYVVNDWLIRQGPTEQFDFNYQPLANQIRTRWVVAEYPAAYYYKGGNKTGFMRDEQYAFFIRWIYNTGERSSSYHIPGRAPKVNGLNQWGETINETQVNIGLNSLSNDEMNFQIYNTATVTQTGLNETTDDGGIIIAKGDMAYWESSEIYSPTRPDLWGDLCGKPIRHHKMPTEETGPQLHTSTQDGNTIRILGVEFDNISPPVDNDGNLISNIVGYEILRGSREGNRSILAKGIFRNMREYDIPEGGQTLNKDKGLYPNFPYNDLRPDIYFHNGRRNADHRTEGCQNFDDSIQGYKPLDGYKKDYFTFHSPELMFRKPFLNAYETRIYGELSGEAVGHFIKSELHPQNKLLRNGGAIIAALIGVGYAIKQVQGIPQKTYKGIGYNNPLFDPWAVAGIGSTGGSLSSTGATYPANAALIAGGSLIGNLVNAIVDQVISNATDIGDIYSGGVLSDVVNELENAAKPLKIATAPGAFGGGADNTITKESMDANLPSVMRAAMGIILAQKNIAFGAQEIIDLMYNLVSYEDYAFKHNSHGFYNEFTKRLASQIFRTKNKDSNYIGSSFQIFEDYKINNLFRPDTVAIATEKELDDPNIIDKSRYVIGGDADGSFGETFLKDPQQEQKKPISALYGALKFSFDNQYGQLDGIKQIQMRGCIELINATDAKQKFSSAPIFSGDVYINRYTEKTIMPIFTDFLLGQPDQYPYNYLQRVNIPYPRYWMDTRKFDTTALAKEIVTLSLSNSDDTVLPNDLFYLDRGGNSCGFRVKDVFGNSNDPNPAFAMRYAYMYTHVNGIQDFFVESEYNLAQRDWDDRRERRHYDEYEYANVDDLFHAEIIKEDNFYKYDLSLSISKFATQLSSFGKIQPRDYDPLIAEKCYQYYPKRLIYSLQAQEEAKKDFWRVFLPNNYKDFRDRVNVIKPINKSGAIIFFPYQSPQMFQGVDQLQTDLGTKLTIGDGGLFSQPFQNIVNSDLPNEYGSCESARSVINTPFGIFFISQAQGKVFQYTGQLNNIANYGMKWWFNKYLPSILLKRFPELENTALADNPVIGIGCQTVFDAVDNIVYFCKKDYSVKEEFTGKVSFSSEENQFYLTTTLGNSDTALSIPIDLGDPLYFDDASWTVSFDPKANAWISFHDWKPELTLPSINHFLTTKTFEALEPSCPPGYTYDSTTNTCTLLINESAPAIVNVEEIPATITGGPEDCLIDIVIAMDVSGSTDDPPGPPFRIDAQRAFVQAFLNDSTISNQMSNGNIQIGFTRWNTTQVSSMTPNGYSMSNTITPLAVAGYYATNPGGGTNVCNGLNSAANVLSQKPFPLSELGDRSAAPNFRNVLIIITDGVATNCIPNNVGCQYQNQDNYDVIAVFCDPTDPTPPAGAQAILNGLTCNDTTKQFTIAANQTTGSNSPTAVAQAVTDVACGTPPECDCPSGYNLVYKDSNGNYTQPNGECDNEDPPICRKIECGCSDFPQSYGEITQSGQCDDLYQVGDPNYINQNPLTCNLFFQESIPANNLNGGLWRHNYRCDLFSNYYDVDYPWEIELATNTGQMVNTVRSVEYQLESYVYKGDLYNGCGDDRWHDLDFNFDEAILYNTEQVSGLLKLELNPKEDPYSILQYPIISNNDIRILYSKEEQKYRFNQFWDITNDRGEFSNAEQNIFITQLNGYIKDLNSNNLNYNKLETQRKKLRHYYNKVLLRRTKSNNRKMLLRLNNTKLNLSFR